MRRLIFLASVRMHCKSVFNTVDELRLEIKEIRGNTDPVLFLRFKISTKNPLPFKLTLLTILIKRTFFFVLKKFISVQDIHIGYIH